MSITTISRQTARRYVLGRQGLWPGRRYRGKQGVAEAIRASECVQVDTINVLARSHDLTLYARVLDYDPAYLEELCYQDRLFFDYGTILMIYPGQDLPYFQAVMRRIRERLANVSEDAQAVRQHVLEEIARRGPLANRDFTDRTRIPGGFNMVKDTSSALYHLYLGGHVMTHSRRNFERTYDLASNVMQSPLYRDWLMNTDEPIGPDEAQTSRIFALKAMRDLGLATPAQWARRVSLMEHSRVSTREAKDRLEALALDLALVTARVEGQTEPCYLPAEDFALLDTLERGDVPASWTPLAATTDAEVTFLAPLDNVIWDRARLQSLFDFAYVWEVYKPAPTRKWGYYTLPILYGDKLVARIAPRLDRKTRTLNVEGFWMEAPTLPDDAFVSALSAGLTRFARFHAANRIDFASCANLTPTMRVLLDKIVPLSERCLV